jgi:predicted  nucleic acid-binding Zn-ribbon protein
MFRKIALGVALLAVGSYLWMGTSLGSYARTGYTQLRGYVQGQVPIEFEIKRAKQLLSELKPVIEDSHKAIIKQEVRVARLETEIERAEKNLKTEQMAIVTLKDQLAKGLTSYRIGSDTYSASDLRMELNRRFNNYRRAEQSVDAKRQSLSSQRASLTATRDKYEGLLQSRNRLEAEIADLEARHKMVEAQQVAKRFQIDDSKLSTIRQAIDEINDRLAVEEQLVESEGNLTRRIPVEDLPPNDLIDQVEQYFGAPKAEKPTAL